ncbi:hypothetical protein [Thiocapsa roseopersicina]|uniref:Uncharacterized protein n=1 Tax=Thiocapsa roseopersicina TaxID=1058 RepID=A0A1H3BZ95_THIRO|nr:hypothetical protein [Thiocapsa roseopersicina]SDX46539.1 hypothetical protein SAMN05421783_12819 [Thiocapsa roseopersicina]
MNTSSIQHPAQPSTFGVMRTRSGLATRGVRTPSARPRPTFVSRRAVEPTVSIEEAIARYLTDQPPQLYRSGA